MTQETLPHGSGRTVVGGVMYNAADALLFVALLNLMIVVMTMAGGILLGFAPALAAAASISRARLRGDGVKMWREFASAWRRTFLHANLLLAPLAAIALMLACNALFFGGSPLGDWVFAVALGFIGVYAVLLVNLDAHYDLRRRDALLAAGRFMIHAPGAPLLIAAAVAVVVAVTWLVPGLLPVISIGAGSYICTALCLSFFAANDEKLSA